MSTKTHFHGNGTVALGMRVLFCSGRAVDFAYTSEDIAEVTCGSCLRKLAKAAA